MTATFEPFIIGHALVGRLAMTDVQADGAACGMVYFLTPCCSASVTGSGNGVACRACYNQVESDLGMAWMWDDVAGWDNYEAVLLRRANDLIDASGVDRDAQALTVDHALDAQRKHVRDAMKLSIHHMRNVITARGGNPSLHGIGPEMPPVTAANPVVFTPKRTGPAVADMGTSSTIGMLDADQDSTGMLF